ncbi:PaaI family thioesterase [Streptomyces sp. NPDC046876]|uniref:PaaI family thioesterase n=1 Tax=Streptomyces sp. NPDC046876 TaxID=3155616 RepID=UPI00340F9899
MVPAGTAVAAPGAPAAGTGSAMAGAVPAGVRTRGRAYLDALLDGTADEPRCVGRLHLVGPTSWCPGQVVAATSFGPEVLLNFGAVFGGYIASLVDHFAGLAMLTVIPDGAVFVTAGLSVGYRAPLLEGPATIEAVVRSMGNRRAVVEVSFLQDGRVTSSGTVEQIIKNGAPQVDWTPARRVEDLVS